MPLFEDAPFTVEPQSFPVGITAKDAVNAAQAKFYSLPFTDDATNTSKGNIL